VESVLGMPVLGLAELDDPAVVSAIIGLQAAVLDQPVPTPVIPWPATEPSWEKAGTTIGAPADEAILAEEHTVVHLTDQR
jgi:hypothetical protein